MPTRREVLEHNLTHLPPRPWCPHCVKGKDEGSPSLRLKGAFAEHLVPRIRLDYCSLTENETGRDETQEGDEDKEEPDKADGDTQTVLVMQESECRSVWSYAVDRKGSSEEWVIHQICEDLETVCLKQDRIIAKEDQEPAIIDVAKEIARNRGERFGTAIDNSRVGDSDSNGTIERAIQDAEGQCRTMRSALDEKIGTKITFRSTITPWLIRHAGYFITRCRVRPNGRTALQMLKGRRSNGKFAEFGELVHFLVPKTKDMLGKLTTDGAKALGWDVTCDQVNTSLEWRVGYFECRQSGRRHQTPDGHQTELQTSLALPPSLYLERTIIDHQHSQGSMAKLPRPKLSMHRRWLFVHKTQKSRRLGRCQKSLNF